MAVTTGMIKELRQLTEAGVLACKRALEETEGDMEKAAELLKEQGMAAAAKKAGRAAVEGRVEAYIHTGAKLGVLVEVNCETDFVARTEGFQGLCHDLAMQVAAADPKYVSRDDVPKDVLEEQKAQYRAEMAGQNKPERIMDRIIEGKLAKFYGESCLLDQEWIRDGDLTIQSLLNSTIGKLGENIVVKQFARFKID